MSLEANKITNLIKGDGKLSYSFEVTPDISEDEIENLTLTPSFFSITWHAKSHECKSLDIAPLQLAKNLRKRNKNVLLHLSCDMMKREYLNKLLTMLQEELICNLFVILGERYDANTSDFKSTQELITYIRQQSGNYFCIGVAGSPDNSENEKLLQLKEKINSGADFVITQAFFEPNIYTNFVKKCKEAGIEVPIIPGIFVFDTYNELTGFINLCKVKVSNDLLNFVQKKEETELPGKLILQTLVQDISAVSSFQHFHFFTLNKLTKVSNFVLSIQ